MTPFNRQAAAQAIEIRQHLWPHTPKAEDPAGEVNTWATMLGHRTLEEVIAVMRVVRSREFAPTLGQIDEALDPQPTASSIFAEFERQHRALMSPIYTPASDVPWSHPAVRAAAEAGLWSRFGYRPDPGFDEYAQANEANWRKEFDRDCDATLSRYRAERLHELTGGQREVEA